MGAKMAGNASFPQGGSAMGRWKLWLGGVLALGVMGAIRLLAKYFGLAGLAGGMLAAVIALAAVILPRVLRRW
jgi:hypothetical protein